MVVRTSKLYRRKRRGIRPEVIKVSETSGFRCGADGNSYIFNNDKLQPLVYSDVAVACHDDNLWYKGRSLSFMDIVSLDAKEFSARQRKIWGK